jgi:hypothetical protein
VARGCEWLRSDRLVDLSRVVCSEGCPKRYFTLLCGSVGGVGVEEGVLYCVVLVANVEGACCWLGFFRRSGAG